MKQITLEIPDGKKAEWVNGALTLVDEAQVDNRPVTERIKTFEDARKELGDTHPLIAEYERQDDDTSKDLLAYLRLRIICAALNEGWQPQFTEDEYRYYPWFYLYTKEEWDELDEEKKKGGVLFGGNAGNGATAGFAFAYSNSAPSTTIAYFGSRLCLKSEALAVYCGKQFCKIWADFML